MNAPQQTAVFCKTSYLTAYSDIKETFLSHVSDAQTHKQCQNDYTQHITNRWCNQSQHPMQIVVQVGSDLLDDHGTLGNGWQCGYDNTSS